jgi:hypothetical protein
MFVILGLYVDDSILFMNNIPLLNTTKMELLEAFDMTNNGELDYCLEIHDHQNRINKIIHINQDPPIWDGKL